MGLDVENVGGVRDQHIQAAARLVLNGGVHEPVSYTHLDVYKRQIQT